MLAEWLIYNKMKVEILMTQLETCLREKPEKCIVPLLIVGIGRLGKIEGLYFGNLQFIHKTSHKPGRCRTRPKSLAIGAAEGCPQRTIARLIHPAPAYFSPESLILYRNGGKIALLTEKSGCVKQIPAFG
jgi:hypothetical protein